MQELRQVKFEPLKETHAIYEYLKQNEVIAKQYFALAQVHQPPIQTSPTLKGFYLSAPALLEGCLVYSVSKIARDPVSVQTLNLLNGKVYYKEREINFAVLFCMLVEDLLCLSNGLKAILETNCLSAKKSFALLAEPMIQEDLKAVLLDSLIRSKRNHRDKIQTWEYAKKDFTQALINKLSFAYLSKYLTSMDMQFWLSFPQAFEIWKKVYLSSAAFIRLPSSSFSADQRQHCYLPWLVLIRRRLLSIESQEYPLLSPPAYHKFCSKVQDLIEWMFAKPRRNFIRWIIPFIFNENWKNTKRRFLYIKGPPSSGKTFLIKILFPPEHFKIKNRTFTHFSNDPPGDYDLHLLLFDDPGECHDRMNKLDVSVLLNLSNYNPVDIKHALPVKYGFMNIMRGQVAIISNRSFRKLFSSQYHDPIKTRLHRINLDSPLPIKVSSAQIKMFKLKEMEASLSKESQSFEDVMKEVDSKKHERIEIEHESEESEEESEEDEESEEQGDVINEELLFYLLWRAILKILKVQLEGKSPDKLRQYIPNQILIDLIQDKKYESLYEIICRELSEKILLQLVYNNSENSSYPFL